MLLIALVLSLLLSAFAVPGLAASGKKKISENNQKPFQELLNLLLRAVKAPEEGDLQLIWEAVDSIRRVDEAEGEVAEKIASHWEQVYLRGDYALYCDQGERRAETLEALNLPVGERHAIVVLGYQLKNGEMTEELKGRCRAAAAVARSFPEAILICSGGPTGGNNPKQHTEAGLMKRYLVRDCGIDTTRILTDSRALNTVANAENTFSMMRKREIQTYTIVTSSYHQKWGQVLYNAMGAMYEMRYGYSARIVGNYCLEIEPEEEAFRDDAGVAIMQLKQLLGLRGK